MNAARVRSRIGTKLTAEMIRRWGDTTVSTGSEICPFGSLTAPPGREEATTAVGAEVAAPPVPYWLAAHTVTRIRCPMSAEVRRCACAEPTAPQLLPAPSQRSQRYAKRVGPFVHEPPLAINVCPSRAMPEITGGTVLAGNGPRGATTAVAAEVAVFPPKAFLALTSTRIVEPTSR